MGTLAGVAETDGRVAQLRDYLSAELGEEDARFAFRWLAACALCPVLRWQLTLALGNRIADAGGRKRPDEDLVLVLARLPWFRSGRMPAELRDALAATLGLEDRHLARAALAEAFETALADPGTAPPRRPGRSGAHLARLIGSLPDGELADPLLATGLRARPAGRRLARLGAWRARLPAIVRTWTEGPRLGAALALLATLLAAAAALPWLDAALERRAGLAPVTVDVTMLRLGACSGPGGYWGRPGFGEGPMRLAAALRLDQVAAGEAFASALVAPNLSSVLTFDASGDGTLWSLQGNGALSYNKRDGDTIGLGSGADGGSALRRVDGEPVFAFTPRGSTAEALLRPLATVSFASREGARLVASRDGAAIRVASVATGAVVGRIGAAGSPLLGFGRTVDGKLVVARCDPEGRIMTAQVTPKVTPPAQPPPAQRFGAGKAASMRQPPRTAPVSATVQASVPAGYGNQSPQQQQQQQKAPPPSGKDGQSVTFTVDNGVLSCVGCKLATAVGVKTLGRNAMPSVTAIMLHDTAGAETGNAPSLKIVTNGSSSLGLVGPLAHFLIGRDGTIHQAASLRLTVNHTGNSAPWNGVPTKNSSSIGIELEHAFNEPYPEAQLASAETLVRGLLAIYRIRTVVGHKEVALPKGRKVDPRLDMDAFRKALGL